MTVYLPPIQRKEIWQSRVEKPINYHNVTQYESSSLKLIKAQQAQLNYSIQKSCRQASTIKGRLSKDFFSCLGRASNAEFSNALRSAFLFSTSGGECTDAQLIAYGKGLMAGHTTRLCSSPSDTPTQVWPKGQGPSVTSQCPSCHVRECGRERGQTGHCPSDGTWEETCSGGNPDLAESPG